MSTPVERTDKEKELDEYFTRSVQLLRLLQERKIKEAVEMAETIKSTCSHIPENSPVLRLLEVKESLSTGKEEELSEEEVDEEEGSASDSGEDSSSASASLEESEADEKAVDVRTELEKIVERLEPLPNTRLPERTTTSASGPSTGGIVSKEEEEEEEYTEEERRIFEDIESDISKEMMNRLAIIRRDR